MSGTDRAERLRECRSCGNLGVGDDGLRCCGEPMTAVAGDDLTIEEPTLAALLRDVFDMSETELDVCLCVMEAGGTTVAELAERIGYDRSVISRHLNHLAELGVLEKRRQLLEGGGQVYVYVPADVDAIRRSFRSQFLVWSRRALSLLDDLNREKVASITEAGEADPNWKIFREE